ncbi:hypothetical protein ACIRL0_36065 [Streptomyces sp. NPDC102365]|uniref:hypothetical protein n=1 Tax=Streptomyces sp. NPDC102365 TaxID=3366162 RepID=UPI003800B41F
MKLVVLFALGLVWGVAFMGIRRARAEDLMPLVRTSVAALSVVTLGALAVLVSDPADVPSLVRTVLGTLR